MNLPALNLPEMLTASGTAGAVLWHLARPFVQPSVERALSAIPAYLAGRARDEFAAAVAGGKVPAPVARFVKGQAAAALAWAQAELGNDADTAAQAALVVDALEHVPYLDKLVSADPADAAHDVAVALSAIKAELAKDTTKTP